MQVYFSHSYRDVPVNSYFLERFVDEEIPLLADQKTDVWCVAKLERYLSEMTGFVSIIPRRPTEQDAAAYSPYIGQELNLARRARVPRLLFVDELVLKQHQLDFPPDAVPFRADALDAERIRDGTAIRRFGKALETAYRLPRLSGKDEATLVVGQGTALQSAAQDVAEILKREGFAVSMLSGRRSGRGLDDIRLLETIWRAELCVFLLSERLSEVHIALAMAHAHCIPSVRLQYDSGATACTPALSGVIRWSKADDMLVEFARQLTNYKEGLVRPADISSTATLAARSIGTMKWRTRLENDWDLQDGPGLIQHIHPDHAFVRDEVARVRAQVDKALGRVQGREGGMDICRLVYDGIRRHRFAYELELVTATSGKQAIRTPSQIATHRTATCLDLACLFASVLEAADQSPLVVILEAPGLAHALAGYRVRGEPNWVTRRIRDLRGALARRDAMLFEATGAVEADAPVGAEADEDRVDKLLGFTDATEAASRMVARSDIQLKHFVDVRALR